jgi:hypothetical protein
MVVWNCHKLQKYLHYLNMKHSRGVPLRRGPSAVFLPFLLGCGEERGYKGMQVE